MQLFLGLAELFKGMLCTYLKQYNDKYSIKNNYSLLIFAYFSVYSKFFCSLSYCQLELELLRFYCITHISNPLGGFV